MVTTVVSSWMAPCQGRYADSRTGQESNGVRRFHPKQIADRYDIEKGDEVWWTDDADGDGSEFIPQRRSRRRHSDHSRCSSAPHSHPF
jgi:hypothetical protein